MVHVVTHRPIGEGSRVEVLLFDPWKGARSENLAFKVASFFVSYCKLGIDASRAVCRFPIPKPGFRGYRATRSDILRSPVS
jgi:hypothetical protein